MNRAIYVNVNGKKKITGIQTRNENICHCLMAICLFYGPPKVKMGDKGQKMSAPQQIILRVGKFLDTQGSKQELR